MYGSCQFCKWMVKNCQNEYNYAKSGFGLDKGCKFPLFTDYFYVKKGHSAVFFICYSKRHADMTRI